MKSNNYHLALLLVALSLACAEASPPTDTARFTASGELVRPTDYREWVLIGTGLGMAYGPVQDKKPAGERPFTNVYVNPSSYRAFLRDAQWPDKTIFILEIRSSVAVNRAAGGTNGLYQGELRALEAEVKDQSRFPGGWGFFSLSESERAGKLIPMKASCYGCHATNAAVENTFVQFYPVLRDLARRKGTFKKVPEVF